MEKHINAIVKFCNQTTTWKSADEEWKPRIQHTGGGKIQLVIEKHKVWHRGTSHFSRFKQSTQNKMLIGSSPMTTDLTWFAKVKKRIWINPKVRKNWRTHRCVSTKQSWHTHARSVQNIRQRSLLQHSPGWRRWSEVGQNMARDLPVSRAIAARVLGQYGWMFLSLQTSGTNTRHSFWTHRLLPTTVGSPGLK